MILQPPPLGYDPSFENERNRNLEAEDLMNRKKRQDVEIATNERLILSSPNGTRYKIVVSDAGVLSATSL
jgi:hypothetical protein